MKPRLLRRSIWWLLPIVLARSLVPGGFMLAAGEHGLAIVMCSGFGPASAPAVSASRVSGHQHPADQAHSGDLAHSGDQAHSSKDSNNGNALHGVPCLYAVSGSPCTSVAWTLETPPPPSVSKIDFCSQATRSCDTPLLDRIRGPPLA